MKFVYTISHPFTDQIVYVGSTRDFERRKKEHLRSDFSGGKIQKYISTLLSNYTIPKIEVIDFVDDTENILAYELFWINIIKSWGFELLNGLDPNPASIKHLYFDIKEEFITVKEYADLREVKVAAVYNAIRANYNMPGVISVKEYGKTKLLEVNRLLITKYVKPCQQS